MSKNIKKTAKLLTALMIINNITPVRHIVGVNTSGSFNNADVQRNLKTLEEAGILDAAKSNKEANLLAAAQRVSNTKEIRDILDAYEKGNYDLINIDSIDESNKRSEDNIKSIEVVMVALGAASLLNRVKASLIDSKVEVKTEAEQSVSEALKTSLSYIDNIPETVSAIITHDELEQTAENSFMFKKINKLIEDVKTSLTNLSGDSSQTSVESNNETSNAISEYEKISDAVNNFSNGVSYQTVAEQIAYTMQDTTDEEISEEEKDHEEVLVSVVANSIAPYIEQKDISDVQELDVEILEDSVKKITDTVVAEAKEAKQDVSELSDQKVQETLSVQLKEFDVKLENSKAAKEEEKEQELINELSDTNLSDSSKENILESLSQSTDQQLDELKGQIKNYEKIIEEQKSEIDRMKAIEESQGSGDSQEPDNSQGSEKSQESDNSISLDADSLSEYEQMKKEREEFKEKQKEYEELKAMRERFEKQQREYEELKAMQAKLEEQQRQLEKLKSTNISNTPSGNILVDAFNSTVNILESYDYYVINKNLQDEYSVVLLDPDGKDDDSEETKSLKTALNNLAEAMEDYRQYQDKSFDVINDLNDKSDEEIIDYYETKGRKAERLSLKKLIEVQIAYNSAVEKAIQAKIFRVVERTLSLTNISQERIKGISEEIFKERGKECISQTELYTLMMKDQTTSGYNEEKSLGNILNDVSNDVNNAEKLVAKAQLNKKMENAEVDSEESSLEDVSDMFENLSDFTKLENKTFNDVDKLSTKDRSEYIEKMKVSNDVNMSYYESQLIDDNVDNNSKVEIANKYIAAKKRVDVIEGYDEYNDLKDKLNVLSNTKYKQQVNFFDTLLLSIYETIIGSTIPTDKNSVEYQDAMKTMSNESEIEKGLKSAKLLKTENQPTIGGRTTSKTVNYRGEITNKNIAKNLLKEVLEIHMGIREDEKRLSALKNQLITSEGTTSKTINIKENHLKCNTIEKLTDSFIDEILIPLMMLDDKSDNKYQINVLSKEKISAGTQFRGDKNNKYFIIQMLIQFNNDIDKISEYIFNSEHFKEALKSLSVEGEENLCNKYWKGKIKIVNGKNEITDIDTLSTYFNSKMFKGNIFQQKNSVAYVKNVINYITTNLEISEEDREILKQIFDLISLSKEEKTEKVIELNNIALNKNNYDNIMKQFGVVENSQNKGVSVAGAPILPIGGIPTAGGPPPPPPDGGLIFKKEDTPELIKNIQNLQAKYPSIKLQKTTEQWTPQKMKLRLSELFTEESPQVLMSTIEKVVDVTTGDLNILKETEPATDEKKAKTKVINLKDLFKTYKSKLGNREDKVTPNIEKLQKIHEELKKYQESYEKVAKIEYIWRLKTKRQDIDTCIQNIKLTLTSDESLESMKKLIKDINEVMLVDPEDDNIFVQENHNNKYKKLEGENKSNVDNIVGFLNEIRKKYSNITSDDEFDVKVLNEDRSNGENYIKLLKEMLTDLITVKEARDRIEKLEKIISEMSQVKQAQYKTHSNNLQNILSEIANKSDTDKITLAQFTTIEKLEIALKDMIEQQKVTEVIDGLMTVKEAKTTVEGLLDLTESKTGTTIYQIKSALNQLKSDLNSKKDEDNITQDQLNVINDAKERLKEFLNTQEDSEEFNKTEEAIKELEEQYEKLKTITYKVVYQDDEGVKETEISVLNKSKSNIGSEILGLKNSFNSAKEMKNVTKLTDINNKIPEIKDKVSILESLPETGEFKTMENANMLNEEEIRNFLIMNSGINLNDINSDIAMVSTYIDKNPLKEVKEEEVVEKVEEVEVVEEVVENIEEKILEEVTEEILKQNQELLAKDEEIDDEVSDSNETDEIEKTDETELNELSERLDDLSSELAESSVEDTSESVGSFGEELSESLSSESFGESTGSDTSDTSSDGELDGMSFDSELTLGEDSQAGVANQSQDFTQVKNKINEFLFNFAKINHGNNLVTLIKLGKQEDVKQVARKINVMQAAFEFGDTSDIIKQTREAIENKLLYDRNYIPYYVALNSCKTFLSADYISDLSEDDLKKVIIISYLYSRYVFDERFDITKTNTSNDIYNMIKNLSEQLYGDGIVTSNSFFDSVINLYTEDGNVYMNEDEICKLDLAAKVLRMSEIDFSNDETDIEKQVDEILQIRKEKSVDSWKKSYQEIDEKINEVLSLKIS